MSDRLSDPIEALKHIQTLAQAAQESDDIATLQKCMKVILALTDKVLPPQRRE
jgi:hypothetical protein